MAPIPTTGSRVGPAFFGLGDSLSSELYSRGVSRLPAL